MSLNWETIAIAAIAIVVVAISKLGRRKGIAEARFDSETGKQIK